MTGPTRHGSDGLANPGPAERFGCGAGPSHGIRGADDRCGAGGVETTVALPEIPYPRSGVKEHTPALTEARQPESIEGAGDRGAADIPGRRNAQRKHGFQNKADRHPDQLHPERGRLDLLPVQVDVIGGVTGLALDLRHQLHGLIDLSGCVQVEDRAVGLLTLLKHEVQTRRFV